MGNLRVLPPDLGVPPGISIQAASRLIEVPAPTLRSWERRYGVPRSTRSTGGHRRYLPDELTELRRMRDEIAKGRRAAEAAELVKATARAPHTQQFRIDEFLRAAHALDQRGVASTLDEAQAQLGLDGVIGDVLLPSMRRIGDWWQAGRCDVAHEHIATEAALGWLNKSRYLSPPPWHSEPVLLSCGPRDLHTLGVEAMAVLLAHRGWPCRTLGARTPVGSLLLTLRKTSSAAVVVVSHLAVARRAAVEALRAAQPSDASLFYAGNAFLTPRSRSQVPGTYLGIDLSAAADQLSECLLARRRTTVTSDAALGHS